VLHAFETRHIVSHSIAKIRMLPTIVVSCTHQKLKRAAIISYWKKKAKIMG